MSSTISSRSAAEAAYPMLRLFIDGRWTDGDGRAAIDVIDPTTEKPLGKLPLATRDDVDTAIEAAARAFPIWRGTPPYERARIIRNAAHWLRQNHERAASLIALELGKPIEQARREFDTAIEILEWSADECRRLYGRTIPARSPRMRLSTILSPIGPVGAIAGWNAPTMTPARKIASALAAGCSIVLKPSEATPACALLFAEAFEAADLPPGVLNIVFGEPPAIAQAFTDDPRIRAITFTGATSVGKQLAAAAGASLKRVILELGGHAPVLVFRDVDVAKLAAAAVSAKFRNAGQVCVSPTRFLIEREIYQPFVDAFLDGAAKVMLGDPFDSRTQMGPLQNARRRDAVAAFVADARKRGATIAQGPIPDGPGFWHAPTTIHAPPTDARLLHEEPFGPIASMSPFDDIDAAITEANRLPAGLAAYAFTGQLAIAERLSVEIQSGSLAINHWQASWPETPFGGIKDSGVGLEGSLEGLLAMTEQRFVSIDSGVAS